MELYSSFGAAELIFLSTHIVLKRDSNKLLVLDIKLEPVVSVHLESAQSQQLQVEVVSAAVLLVPGTWNCSSSPAVTLSLSMGFLI